MRSGDVDEDGGVERAPSGERTIFDRYVVVDWSANARPKRGTDSVWICELADIGDARTENPPTRGGAERSVRASLVDACERGERTLVCFDFPYAYPAGFASALGLPGEAWRAVWDFLRDRVEDDPSTNANDRFAVASAINARLVHHAFWGASMRRSFSHLSPRRDVVRYAMAAGAAGPSEWRVVEGVLRRRGYRPHSVWKLLGAGAVGSQTLVGIPVLARLRDDPTLADVSRVWPFEVGVPDLPPGLPAVVHAEIWPSLRRVEPAPGRVKDELQVIGLAHELRALDRAASLRGWFAAAPDIAREEGWILGVT
jgi:hypothetical protein